MPFELTFGADDVRIVRDEVVWSGHYAVHRKTLQYRSFSGGWNAPVVREVFERGDAVGVLPYDPVRDCLVMVEQFRPGALRGNDSPWMLELIAGVVENDETDEQVARREALEEADCTLSTMVPIATVFPSAGGCSEQVRLYCARIDGLPGTGVHGLQDEGEDILVHHIPRDEAMALLAADKIPNGHTLIALQWLHIHARDLRERWS
jgi:ADP-ribose pyrophosphatase